MLDHIGVMLLAIDAPRESHTPSRAYSVPRTKPVINAAEAGARSFSEPIFDQHPQRDDSVAPRDLLPVFVATAVVRDRHLVDAVPALEHLRGDLGLDAKTVGPER